MKAHIKEIHHVTDNGQDYVTLTFITDRIPKNNFKEILDNLFQGQVEVEFK
jgi:hypothetical protein